MENNNSKEIGNYGEKKAAEYLQKKGYTIREVNWFYNHREIDIIAELPPKGNQKYSTLVIVEVKTRTYRYPTDEMPHTAVTRDKQRLLIQATNQYIEKFDIDADVRYDIVSVIMANNTVTIDHIEDAFYPRVNVY